MNGNFVFSSESVTEGHPDKLCDQISDAIVDRFLQYDPFSQITTECCVSNGILFIAGKYSSKATIDIPNVARQVITQTGYKKSDFNAENCTIMTNLIESEIRPFVHESDDIENKEQVTVFGYACDHTPAYMPMPIWLSHKIAQKLSLVRQKAILPYLLPDGKVQVGIEFKYSRPHRLHTITIFSSHTETDYPSPNQFEKDIIHHVVRPSLEGIPLQIDQKTLIAVNPAGPLPIGGPSKHSGLTGRKTGMDTYGEFSRYSSSALSGKDPSRVERIAAYAARHAAKNIVAANLAKQCEVQLSYSIGTPYPVGIRVKTYENSEIPEEHLSQSIGKIFDFRPSAIIRRFNLRHLPKMRGTQFYRYLAAYGHFGREELNLPWEKLDQVETLRKQ